MVLWIRHNAFLKVTQWGYYIDGGLTSELIRTGCTAVRRRDIRCAGSVQMLAGKVQGQGPIGVAHHLIKTPASAANSCAHLEWVRNPPREIKGSTSLPRHISCLQALKPPLQPAKHHFGRSRVYRSTLMMRSGMMK